MRPATERVHVLVDGPAAPDWNMALDEALLRQRQAGAIEGTWVRLFAWRPPAISVGRLQSAAADLDLAGAARDGIPVVRRATGGKAVFHAHEVTYSLVGGVPDPEWGSNLHETYRRVSAILVAGLERLGVETAFAPRRPPRSAAPRLGQAPSAMEGVPSDLEAACFAVAYGHELVAGGRKICGSAQRRLTRAFLQHGSLLLGPEQATLARYLRLPGNRTRLVARLAADTTDVSSAAGRPVTPEELTDAIVRGLAERFGARLIPVGQVPPTVHTEAERLRAEVRVAGFPAPVDSSTDAG